ncbi:MAG: diguanylate cyclase [Sulfuritalea sp.]|nr:diguanylate cyclase [Sulfuritalea sp.]
MPHTKPNFSPEVSRFIDELDAAVESHMNWTRRVVRCAVLHESPGKDVLDKSAHTLCRFGHWFESSKAHFKKIEPQKTRKLDAVHQTMHDAIRSICREVMAGRPGKESDLETFEQTQPELIKLLAEFKTQFLAGAARHDPLTGLPLRYGIENEFAQVKKICRRYKTRLYVGMIDADHFKRINDNFGHPVGDKALCHLADTLRSIVRPNEPLFRFGGEEFLLFMQCRTHEEAAAAGQRIVSTVRSKPVPIAHHEPLVLTVTLGLARAGNDETMSAVIERADKALYLGKQSGRDRCVIADDLPD